jgi:mono/diheme cytochrome c family protein
MHGYAAFLLLLLTAVPAHADEQPVELKPGPGQDIVQNECGVCHSLDYIRMNSLFLTADGWKAEVTKMRAAFGAPIDNADADAIIKYLLTHYGAPAK